MTIYRAPDWLYKPAKINQELYPQIRRELLQIWRYKFNDTPARSIRSHFVVPAPTKYVIDNCPALIQQLSEFGLADSFLALAMIVIGHDNDYPIHVDTINTGFMSVGLNIPVFNCECSYTAWYDAEILYHETFNPYIMEAKGYSTAIPCDNSEPVEIGRCDANIPHWINVTKPHNAITEKNRLRVNSSLRFDKKIFEMISDGSFNEKCTL
jgi:hypothetical protein